MEKTERMTNRKALEIAIAVIGDSNEEAVAKLSKMIEQIDKKNAAPKKKTAQQEWNEVFKIDILAFLRENRGSAYTVSDLLTSVPSCAGESNQRVSALLRALVNNGDVVRFVEKRRTYFKAA